MRKIIQITSFLLFLVVSAFGQQKRLWVLRTPGEMVEYDVSTFAVKQRVKVPPEAMQSPASLSVNRLGQILFAPTISLPLSDEDVASPHKVWFWDGAAATTINQGIEHKTETIGSNQAVIESAPTVSLSVDGKHLFWFANQTRRLQREEVDLSSEITWQAWRTDLAGAGREELVSAKLPECRCKTGTCEESCPSGVVWSPEEGIEDFFFMTQFVAGQTGPVYKASTRYREAAGKWSGQVLPQPLQRILETAGDGDAIVEAIPDTGCCGWSNQSNDQTLILVNAKTIPVFDEQATYKNPDYDVSFYTANARLSPKLDSIAMTIVATAAPNKPIQLSEEGQASPEESQHIRKSLAELPAISLKTVEDSPKQFAWIPHASLVGWISEKELLIVEDHILVRYEVETGARRKTSVRVDDAAHVFLR